MTAESAFAIEEVRDLDAAWPELSALFLELSEFHETLRPRGLREDWSSVWRDHLALHEDRLVLIARDNEGEAVGFFSAEIRRRSTGLFGGAVGYIEDAYVRPAARRRGVGAALLAREEWCRSRGMAEVRLGVVAGNEVGLSFWQKAGFGAQMLNVGKKL